MSAGGFGSVGSFTSTALGSDRVRLVDVVGNERIGQLFEFHVRIAHDKGPLTQAELDALLLQPCCLTIGKGDPVNGIVREIEAQEALVGRVGIYDLVMVPTVWLLTVSKLSRLYQQMSVKDMAADVLKRYGLTGHFELRIKGAQPRDFCIQYEESDWDFLSRWFEHEGYFYWFEHTSNGEKLIVADGNDSTTPLVGDTKLPYADEAGLNRTTDSVMEWRAQLRRIPAAVVLKDYNDQKPLLPMVGQADVDRKNGFGVFFEYGDNFDTPSAGAALAKKRAERFLTERLTLKGVTDCTRFHVGHWFELEDHFDHDQNQKYLITAIHHRLGSLGSSDGGPEKNVYRAAFECIPFKVPFRPERTTSWPSIHGLMHGHIDSDSEGKFSTLDHQARYKVRFPFDSTSKTGDGCSTWVRMAQSYAGSGYGQHYPLHKGTEVLLAFYDGDPDRPMIVGTVPNAVTPGPSAAANATQSVTKTASGIQIVMDDQIGG